MSQLHVHSFEAKALDLFLSPAPETPRTDDFHLATYAEALAQYPEADAVLDGAMFSFADPNFHNYKQARWATLNFDALTSSGISTHGMSSTDHSGMTFSRVGDMVTVRPGAEAAPNAEVVIQTFPPLVRDGANAASPKVDTDDTWRAGMGVLKSGKCFFAVGHASMYNFAQAVIDSQKTNDPVISMGYTDGGGSACLAFRDGRRFGSTENRRVLAWLVAKKL